MNNKLLIAGAAIASISISTLAIAASDTGNATANIVAPITITNTSDLQFGDIVAAAGTVTIAADGTPGGTLSSTGTQSAGTFDITGEGTKTFSIAIATVSNLTDGTDTIPLSAYTNTEGGATGTLVGGALTLGVGATITLTGTEGAGAYTGSYSVTVDYN